MVWTRSDEEGWSNGYRRGGYVIYPPLVQANRSNIMKKDINDSILEELLCPVCQHYMCPPIYLCVTGHSICEDCFKKVKTCPKCRASKSNNARNYALEGVHAKLKVPCKFAINGCDIILPGEDIKKHQVFYCSHAKMRCPFRYSENCQWNCSKTTFRDHLDRRHIQNFYLEAKQKLLARSFTAIENYHYYFLAVIYAYDQFFRLAWEVDEITGITRWAVYYIGSPEDAKNYSYKLEFYKDEAVPNSCTPLTYKSMCIAKIEPETRAETQKFVGHHYFYVHRNVLLDYCTKTGDLNYKVSIYCVKKSFEDNEPFFRALFDMSTSLDDDQIQKGTCDKTCDE